jgi:hypothetical protein
MRRTITVLDPTAKPGIKRITMAPRLHDLNGKVAGFLWNSKANGDLLLERIKEQLVQRFSFAGVIWRQKPAASEPADSAIIDVLADTCSLVINAQGD